MRVAAIGECMLEVSGQGDAARLGFGGDTLNTAIYLARLGIQVDYMTALGDDPLSDDMLAAWEAEGIGTRLVARVPGQLPGLYVIRTGAGGERRFFYWRDRAPARALFESPDACDRAAALCDYDLLYFSGITLSLYRPPAREIFFTGLARARAGGTRVAFDTNYRPAGWPDPATAAATFAAACRLADIALPTLEDEDAVYPSATGVAACLARLRQAGVGEAAIKCGAAGCVLLNGDRRTDLPPPLRLEPVDTTAAGDSFNAGYLAARLSGMEPEDAAARAARLAGRVIQYPGAIMPADAMPADAMPSPGPADIMLAREAALSPMPGGAGPEREDHGDV